MPRMPLRVKKFVNRIRSNGESIDSLQCTNVDMNRNGFDVGCPTNLRVLTNEEGVRMGADDVTNTDSARTLGL